MAELKNNLDYHIEYNKTVGSKYLVCPWAMTETPEQVAQLKAIIDAAKEHCKPEWFVIEWEAFDMDCIEAVRRSYNNYIKLA